MHNENGDFEEYDATPYGGGYDQALVFGRPLPPDEELCYPIDSTSSHAPNPYAYSSGGRNMSGYDRNDDDDGSGYDRRKTRPTSEFHPQEEEGFGAGDHDKSKPIPDYQHGYEGEGKVKPFGYDDEGGLAKYGRTKTKPAAYGFRPEPESYSTPVPPVEHSYGFERPEYGRRPPSEDEDYGFNGRQHDQGGRRTPPRMEEDMGLAHGDRHQPEFGKGHRYGESEERQAYGGEYGGRTSHHREEQEERLEPSFSGGEHEDEAYGRHRYKSKDDNDDDDGERRHQNRRHHNLRHDDD